MAEFNWLPALLGGIFIGVSSTIFLAWNGRVAGISGITFGLLRPLGDGAAWRWFFIGGLLLGGIIYRFGLGLPLTQSTEFVPVAAIIGGLLVGVGTSMGNGCTSGHRVCGISRASPRSLVNVAVFMGAGMATVACLRHLA